MLSAAAMSITVDITARDVQDGTESVLERWLRQPGEAVRQHEPLVEINTDKAVVEIPSPASGVLREVLKQTNDPVGPGDVLGRIEVTGEGEPRPAPPVGRIANPSHKTAARTQDLSPAVRQLVKKHNLDVSRIPGSGRGGRITHEDVQNFLKQQPTTSGDQPPTGRRVPHSPLRRRIAQHMVDSLLRTAPHVTAVFEADLTAIVAHRHQHQAAFQQRGVKLTYTAYFVAAAVQAVQAVPEVNSRWHDDALEVFTDCNIGIATAVEGGLLVPVIPQAQNLDLFGIAARLQELTQKARAGKLEPADLRHGTLTITNHGVSGSLIATPIINQPQSAIVGVGKMEKRLVVIEEKGRDSIQVRPMAYVTLTIDHRALDGFQANLFLTRFLEALNRW
jgi:2-oxoglutarate dehydrogenase E2 component (dihydrolipoamide succinyltransferase)